MIPLCQTEALHNMSPPFKGSGKTNTRQTLKCRLLHSCTSARRKSLYYRPEWCSIAAHRKIMKREMHLAPRHDHSSLCFTWEKRIFEHAVLLAILQRLK